MMSMFQRLQHAAQLLTERAKWLVWIVVVVAVISFIGVFRSPHFFPVKVVKVNGYFPEDAQTTIQSVIEPYASKGFFSADIQAIQQELEQLPWVKEARVARVWPDRFDLTVNEAVAVAIWNDTSLVLPDGQIYLPTFGSLPKNLPHFTGKHGENEKILDMYKKMHDIVQTIGLNISHVLLLDNNRWQITLSNHTIVLLGSTSVLARLERYVSIYPGTFSGKSKQPYQVDMRYSHGMAVNWKKTE